MLKENLEYLIAIKAGDGCVMGHLVGMHNDDISPKLRQEARDRYRNPKFRLTVELSRAKAIPDEYRDLKLIASLERELEKVSEKSDLGLYIERRRKRELRDSVPSLIKRITTDR